MNTMMAFVLPSASAMTLQVRTGRLAGDWATSGADGNRHTSRPHHPFLSRRATLATPLSTNVPCSSSGVPPLKMMSTNTPSTGRRAKIVEGPFNGQFGSWNLTQGDVDDVQVYRSCLLACAGTSAAAIALALTVGLDAPPRLYDALALLSSIAFGGALQTIHIYARPLHTALKALWALGLAGGITLAISPLTATVQADGVAAAGVMLSAYQHPALLLAFGWQFVALTGLFIKEAVCFGRTEALLLIALVPILSGGHFLNVLPMQTEQSGAILFSSLFLLFALRKFTQPATDDIGDMSVFQYFDSNSK